jgi:hypothetical protein
MFSLLSGIYNNYFAAPQLNLLVVGAQGVGKTALLERIKVTQFEKKTPKSGSKFTSPQPTPDNWDLRADKKQQQSAPPPPPPVDTTGMVATTPNGGTKHIEAAPTTTAPPSQRRYWICPAPQKYKNAAADDDDDDDVIEPLEFTHPPAQTPVKNHRAAISAAGMIHHPIDPPATTESVTQQQQEEPGELCTAPLKEYIARGPMLPMHRMRPTIGMNLAKLPNVCGALVQLMDVGGRMVTLWERYYADCDAVVFVLKLQGGQVFGQEQQQHDDDEEQEQVATTITDAEQLALLDKCDVRFRTMCPF